MSFLPSVDSKLTLLTASTSSGTSSINGGIVDMAGYRGVLFFTTLATADAGNYMKVQEDTASNLGTAADLAGTKATSGTNGGPVTLYNDVHQPIKRYLRPVVVRAGAASVCGDIYALQYGAIAGPKVNNSGTAQVGNTLVGPAEGTP